VSVSFLSGVVGRWSGSSRLWLEPDQEPRECAMEATIRAIAGAAFVRIEYTWTFDGRPQDGELLLCRDARASRWNAVWIDSWHMPHTFMHSTGSLDHVVDIEGGYAVPGHPDWGWRTRIELEGETLVLHMWNVSPEGEAALAVHSRLERTHDGAVRSSRRA
jgi:hypothetical protein